jgi:hypothetical protein
VTNPVNAAAQARWAWACVAALVLGGYAVVVAPAQRELGASLARTKDMYDVAYRNADLLKRSAGLQEARDRVARDIAHLSGARTAARATLNLLQLLDHESAASHVTVAGLAPETSGESVSSAGSLDVTIEIRGTYRAVLFVIRDASRHDVLLEISEATLFATGDGTVDSTLRGTLFYDVNAIVKEKPNVDEAPEMAVLPSLEPLHFPASDVLRDPFAVIPAFGAQDQDVVGGSIVLPPNAGADGGVARAAPVLRGIVEADRPEALVETGGRSMLVQVGSPLLGSSVVRIDKGSLRLRNGAVLRVMEPRP